MATKIAIRKPRSPIKSFLRPFPGATVFSKIQDLRLELFYGVVIVINVTMAVVFIATWAWLSPENVYLAYLALLIAVWGRLGYTCIKVKKNLKKLHQGLDGERAVAQELDVLRESGHHILHSIDMERFDIDHAIVGPTGVYVVETKTVTKRGGAEEKVIWDGKTTTIGTNKPHDKHVTQAEACARALRDIIYKCAGEKLSVQPVVVYPGWFVAENAQQSNVWVKNPKMLASAIAKSPVTLTQSQITKVVFGIERHQQHAQLMAEAKS